MMSKYVRFVSLVMAMMMVVTFTTVALATDSNPLPEGVDWIEFDIKETMDDAEWALGYRPSFLYSCGDDGNGVLEVFLPDEVVKIRTFYDTSIKTHPIFGCEEEINRFNMYICEKYRKQYNLMILQLTKTEGDVQFYKIAEDAEIFGKGNDWYIKFYTDGEPTVIREIKTFRVLPDGSVVVDKTEIEEATYRAQLNL